MFHGLADTIHCRDEKEKGIYKFHLILGNSIAEFMDEYRS